MFKTGSIIVCTSATETKRRLVKNSAIGEYDTTKRVEPIVGAGTCQTEDLLLRRLLQQWVLIFGNIAVLANHVQVQADGQCLHHGVVTCFAEVANVEQADGVV
jgi:hypothetical protein